MLDTSTTITAEPATSPVLAPPHSTLVEPPMTLPEAINAAHDAVKGSGKTMLLKAKEAGELLLQAKAQCAHGEFKAWIEENCAFSYKTAAKYMKVAKSLDHETFDLEAGVDAFLGYDKPRKPANPDEEDGQSPMRTPATEAPKPSTTKELKAEIDRLAEELQAARDALATAEAYIETLKGQASVASLLAQEAGEPPASGVADTIEELTTLRQDVADLTEMLNTSEADRKALKEEVSGLKRQLRKATEASPLAEAAIREKPSGPMVDHDGYVMQHPGDF